MEKAYDEPPTFHILNPYTPLTDTTHPYSYQTRASLTDPRDLPTISIPTCQTTPLQVNVIGTYSEDILLPIHPFLDSIGIPWIIGQNLPL